MKLVKGGRPSKGVFQVPVAQFLRYLASGKEVVGVVLLG